MLNKQFVVFEGRFDSNNGYCAQVLCNKIAFIDGVTAQPRVVIEWRHALRAPTCSPCPHHACCPGRASTAKQGLY